jgi:hypothetical protein
MAWQAAAGPVAAQVVPSSSPLPGSRITDSGVARAGALIDSVFVLRTRLVDTVDIGDFAAHVLARLGVPPFGDSLRFRVTADSARIRISGRLDDFPADERNELRPIFFFVDSSSVFVAEISMPQSDSGIMRFRLERVMVKGFVIPDILLLPALQEFDDRYPILAANGREFLVAMPLEAHARLIHDAIELSMPPSP